MVDLPGARQPGEPQDRRALTLERARSALSTVSSAGGCSRPGASANAIIPAATVSLE